MLQSLPSQELRTIPPQILSMQNLISALQVIWDSLHVHEYDFSITVLWFVAAEKIKLHPW